VVRFRPGVVSLCRKRGVRHPNNDWGLQTAQLGLDTFAHVLAIVQSFPGYWHAFVPWFLIIVDMMDRSDLVTTGETARAIIEDIARRKGTFTRAFIREAHNEAKAGRPGMLQVIESGVEIREDFSKLLKL
jgi:hypothetical protein